MWYLKCKAILSSTSLKCLTVNIERIERLQNLVRDAILQGNVKKAQRLIEKLERAQMEFEKKYKF
ncbi:hypothetical protein C9I89_08030 [Photobacterium lipolyticum]|uniref:Uncharacterized protein n=1 Tax=Photobacterium lipolyticum TaxID=266810 RepID=A0A2T3N095_9GAMM|nr:hypothetical protein C9I89_08030 [Photobacterium lipolyticum]